MEHPTIDAVTRRASLLALGLAGLAAPHVSSAKKKKNGKKDDRCKKQVAKCEAGLADLCLAGFGEEDVPECLELFGPCCAFLKNCDTGKAFACAVEATQSIV